MIELLGKHYAKNLAEAVKLLREHGEAFAGFYRTHTNGVLFLDRKREPFAYAARDTGTGGTFFVTAYRRPEDGHTWYMFSTSTETEKRLGIDEMLPSVKAAVARAVIEQAGVTA